MLFKHKNPNYCAMFRAGGKLYKFTGGKIRTENAAAIELLKKMINVSAVEPKATVVKKKEVEVIADEVKTDTPKPKKKEAKKK